MTTRPASGRMSRRRFLTISAAAAGYACLPDAAYAAPSVHRWQGIGLGADATILLAHPDRREAERLFDLCAAEIRRLEKIFSLYDADSALSRLNRDGSLAAPPLEFVALLALAGQVHAASGGIFDPTVQPLWSAYARHYGTDRNASAGPPRTAIEAALRMTGWHRVAVDTGEIRFAEKGMAMTLNGIAQGYITDRVADLLTGEGLENVLVDIGEIRALGSAPDGAPWPVRIRAGAPDAVPDLRIGLRARALATSVATGTSFDAEGRVGHVLDPRSGQPVSHNMAASAFAPSAAIADGLSTAALGLDDAAALAALSAFPGTGLRLVRPDGTSSMFGATA